MKEKLKMNETVKEKLMTVVEGDSKAPFSLATTPKCTEGATLFTGLLQFTLDMCLIMLCVKQGSIKYIFLSLTFNSRSSQTSLSGLQIRVGLKGK